jgi:PAS domain S-box-containing protein
MSGGADLFRVLSQTETLGVLVADSRPSLVVDRAGNRLLWANAAGAAFFGVTSVEKLTDLRFASNSPFARRIATLDEMLVSGQDRIERLPLQRGLLPRPTVCKASRVSTDGVKAILLTIVDGTGSFAGDPAAAFATLAATAQPMPHEDIAEVVEDIEPAEAAVAQQSDDAGQIEIVSDDGATDEINAGEAPLDLAVDDTEAVTDAPLPEATETTDAAPEETTLESLEEDTSFEPDAPAENTETEAVDESVEDAQDAEPEQSTAAGEDALSEPAEQAEQAEAVSEDPAAEVVDAVEPPSDDAPIEPVEALPETAAEPAFVFPAHGRAVRFVFELDPRLAFTFVSADLAATVGPDMADILGRTWAEVAGRLEFDPAGRIAEALGHRDTFTGLTVDWPVEGENLRVPADLAGMPVFGRERAFRGYRGFGVLKTGAAFEAPVPAEPIAASEPDDIAPLPLVGSAAPDASLDETTAGEEARASDESLEQPVAEDIEVAGALPTDVSEPESASTVTDETAAEDMGASTDVTPEIESTGSDTADTGVMTEQTLEEPAEVEPASAAAEPVEDAEQARAEETEAPEAPTEIVVDEPVELAAADTLGETPVGDAETSPEPIADVVEPTQTVLGEPDVAEDQADELPEPLPLVSPPAEEDTVEAAEPELAAPTVSEVAASPASHRTAFNSLTGDKARALSKPERDAFDKIAEALADAFGPRIIADPADRLPVHPTPMVGRKPDVPAEAGPVVDIALLDKLPVALAILRGGDIIHANRAFLDLCGYPDIATIDADGGFAQVFEGAALSRDAAIPAVRRRDGVEIPVSARLHSMPMDGGIASLLVVQETAAATSRDRLATAEQRAEDMEAILDTATDGVLVLDHKGLVIGANKSAEALFGTERSHMIGMAFVDLLAPESHRSALDYLDGLGRNALSSVLNDGREVIGRVAGGGLVPLFMTVGRVSTTKFCAVLRDITQWKRAEEELTSAKKAAENASSQKSDFLAKMSHEIRTPLNAIIGFSEVMMEERFGPVGNDRYKEYLRDIHVSGTHIMSLVNDLLDLSKIEAGKLELTFEAVGLNDVVRECAALMQPQANRERIIIRTSLSSSLPPVVADNRSLRQIILNLLSNAVKFNSAGGQVIVSTLYEESGEVVLRVRDTGQGMSEGDIVKAMEPFRQLSTSRTGGGTGLGLPLTKALVEANRASFQIDSTPGQGTMIQITFPSTRVLAE